MSDKSIQDLIYKPVSENLDIVIREIIKESEQVLYLTYHTIWHLLSGITGLLWVVTISQ